jgi:hypothetical protein
METATQAPAGIGRNGGARPGAGRKPKTEQNDAYLLYAKAKAQKEAYSAKKAELELKLMNGALVAVDDVIPVVTDVVRSCKEYLLGIPGRFSDLFAAETDARAIERVLESEIRAALQKIAEVNLHEQAR